MMPKKKEVVPPAKFFLSTRRLRVTLAAELKQVYNIMPTYTVMAMYTNCTHDQYMFSVKTMLQRRRSKFHRDFAYNLCV